MDDGFDTVAAHFLKPLAIDGLSDWPSLLNLTTGTGSADSSFPEQQLDDTAGGRVSTTATGGRPSTSRRRSAEQLRRGSNESARGPGGASPRSPSAAADHRRRGFAHTVSAGVMAVREYLLEGAEFDDNVLVAGIWVGLMIGPILGGSILPAMKMTQVALGAPEYPGEALRCVRIGPARTRERGSREQGPLRGFLLVPHP